MSRLGLKSKLVQVQTILCGVTFVQLVFYTYLACMGRGRPASARKDPAHMDLVGQDAEGKAQQQVETDYESSSRP